MSSKSGNARSVAPIHRRWKMWSVSQQAGFSPTNLPTKSAASNHNSVCTNVTVNSGCIGSTSRPHTSHGIWSSIRIRNVRGLVAVGFSFFAYNVESETNQE